MQVTFDLIDYHKLAGNAPEAILFGIFEDDEEADRIFLKSGYDFGVSDSYAVFGKCQDFCEQISANVTETRGAKWQALECGLFRMFVPSLMYDDLGFNRFPEEGYISSVSTEHLILVHQGFQQLEQETAVLDSLFNSSGIEYRPILQSYVNAIRDLIEYGAGQNQGLLIHLG